MSIGDLHDMSKSTATTLVGNAIGSSSATPDAGMMHHSAVRIETVVAIRAELSMMHSTCIVIAILIVLAKLSEGMSKGAVFVSACRALYTSTVDVRSHNAESKLFD
jgi:hypothetical protein